MLTIDQQFKLIAQLGLVEGVKAGAFQDSTASKAAITALAPVTVANATDEATAITLVNALKVSLNAVIAALKTA